MQRTCDNCLYRVGNRCIHPDQTLRCDRSPEDFCTWWEWFKNGISDADLNQLFWDGLLYSKTCDACKYHFNKIGCLVKWDEETGEKCPIWSPGGECLVCYNPMEANSGFCEKHHVQWIMWAGNHNVHQKAVFAMKREFILDQLGDCR